MKFLSHQLENGLEIVAECNEDSPTLAVGFFVKTGARDETDDVSGVSHFLEHMVFKGTPRRSAEDVNREFDEMGAHYNAFTSEENTVYYAAILPEQQRQAVDLLADILRPSLREEDFLTEKKVILEEIAMYQDQPPFGADDQLKELYFGQHPLSRSVLGTTQSIEALRVEQMRDYFQQRYGPRTVFVAAAGNVDFPALIEQVEDRCGNWPSVDADRAMPPIAPAPGFQAIRKESSTQQYILQCQPGPPSHSPQRFAAKILATMLGDDSGSRIYWDMVDPGIAEQASFDHHEYEGAGIYFSWATCEPERTPEILGRLQELFAQAQAEGFSQEEFEQARSKIRARVVLASEKTRTRLFVVGGNWSHRHEYRSVADDLKTIDDLTLDDVHTVLKDFPLLSTTTVTVGPLEEGNLKTFAV